MNVEDIINELQIIHCKLKNNRKIDANTSFKDLGYDSLDFVEFIMEVEKKYNTHFSNLEVVNIRCPFDLISIIYNNQIN